MTEPTDDEIATLYTEQTGFALDDSPAALLDFARAVLAKWGTPPAMEGEPVAYRHMHDDGWEYYDAPTGSDCPGCEPLYLTPQPTQAQAEAGEPDYATFALWYTDHIGDENKPVRNAALATYEAFAPRQPTQPQAGAVPLTPEQVAEIADAAHREYDRLVSSGQCAPRWSAVFAHLLEMHHGIKGGPYAE